MDVDVTAENTRFTMNAIQVNLRIYKKEDKLFAPHSKAKDFNGFSKRTLIDLIKNENIEEEIIKFGRLLTNINNDIFRIFLHNKARTILFKKKKGVDEQKDLRTIAILPARLIIIMEKLVKPQVHYIINVKINKNQFGFSLL